MFPFGGSRNYDLLFRCLFNIYNLNNKKMILSWRYKVLLFQGIHQFTLNIPSLVWNSVLIQTYLLRINNTSQSPNLQNKGKDSIINFP